MRRGELLETVAAALRNAHGIAVRTIVADLANPIDLERVAAAIVSDKSTATDIWEISVVPLSALDPKQVMPTEDCVDAAFAGLDLGEAITMPAVEKMALFHAYESARLALVAATSNSTPASRYSIAK